MASAGDGGRLGTESSVPAFSRTFARTKGGIRAKRGLTGAPDFLSNDPPECLFQGLFHTRDMSPQGIVDQALVIAAARLLNQGSKLGDYIFVQPDGDPRLPLGNRHHRPALRLRKTVFTFHSLSRIAGVRAASPSVPGSDAHARPAM